MAGLAEILLIKIAQVALVLVCREDHGASSAGQSG